MRRVLLLVLVLGLSVTSAFAQATGQINGVVSDNSGGVVPGVTVYAVDARGLGSGRDSEAARVQLLKAARDSQQQMLKRGSGAVTVDEVMIAESAEESLRANVQSTLREFAQSTGGFLTADTNDFKPNMQRIATDIGSYYEAAYAPVSQELDGRFRRGLRRDQLQ